MILLHLPLLLGFLSSAVPRLGGNVHWLANTSGKPDDHIQNFIEDMSVVYVSQNQYPKPMVLTKSFWDEGHVPNGAYSNGRRIEKNWWLDSTSSRIAKRGRDTCRIENFYGRGFLYKLAFPPTSGDSVPVVACNDGTRVESILDPTAIAFDLSGRLLVADNGPDQNVKIFRRNGVGWILERTFGETGGVFGGPRPGAAGPRRFWGIRGLGVDSAGTIYVGNTGIPMQTMGGTDIRAFSSLDSSLIWQVQGLAFVNSADFDPDSAGNTLYTNSKRFSMDWTQPAGKSWKLAAITLDPLRFPDDIRLQAPLETAWVRKIGGAKFLFLTTMRSDFVAVFRFLEGQDIVAPCAVFTAGSRQAGPWMDTLRPVLDSSAPLSRRWAWIDANGDGSVQKEEFQLFDLAYPYVKGVDIDASGSIRMGGRGISLLRCTGVDAHGVPTWAFPVVRETVPFTEGAGDALRLQYQEKTDRMLLSGATSRYPDFLYVVEGWSTDHRTWRRIALPHLDSGSAVIPRLDINTYAMVLPTGFTADDRFVYVPFIDRGPDARCIDVQGSVGPKGATMKCRGEISVLDLRTGDKVGYFAPDSGVGWFAGAFDMNQPLNVAVLADGRRILSAEEDGTGKILLYNWCPPGEACRTGSSGASPPPKPTWTIEGRPWGMVLRGLPPGPNRILVRDMEGRILLQSDREGPRIDLRLPSSPGVVQVQVQGRGARRVAIF
ncbi:MAG: hypothetical protein H6686_01525 [Fibrobacteria bacterium]|nr:hypothetical protein [Fibrobacteria bacterium]